MTPVFDPLWVKFAQSPEQVAPPPPPGPATAHAETPQPPLPLPEQVPSPCAFQAMPGWSQLGAVSALSSASACAE
ncbi:hypothetical protein Pdca_34260 [Pseudonocardia autotrophica]|nr:hypothetical protein Pdca_34260 [Pseudonocardia autotrophica]